MSWTLLVGVVLVLMLSLSAAVARRRELGRMSGAVQERDRVVRQGGARARLQHPVIDLSRCMGCGTCVSACPEDGVLELVHGQAAVVNPARCEGIAACARECPVGAISVTLADLADRRDVPVLTDELESPDSPGLFLAGEITAHALIKSAIDQGARVGEAVARRTVASATSNAAPDLLDLCVVGAGPAGLACSLEAQRHGLRFVTLDREQQLGGTVAKYPRRKLVLTQPVDLPDGSPLDRKAYTKEELVDLWQRVADERALPIRQGEQFERLDRDEDGNYVVKTAAGEFRARNVCLAIGRRGDPVKLGVPGEDLAKVTYGLMDAQAYQDRKILVVGGGDSAVEAALALSEQPGNEVTLSYRKESLFRVRARNLVRLEERVAERRLTVLYRSEVRAIGEDRVRLTLHEPGGERLVDLANDDVFVMAGGSPPFELLANSGVSFDPTHREPPPVVTERGAGLVRALKLGLALATVVLLWALFNFDYYTGTPAERAASPRHHWLRSGRGVGLAFGIASAALVVANLLYLVRRSPAFRLEWGSLSGWMTSHVATGILAVLLALLHAGMDPRSTAGGHGFWALVALLVTGAIGRYFYSWVPRAANGRELELAEVRAKLAGPMIAAGEGTDALRAFKQEAGARVLELIERRQWHGTWLGRVAALLGIQRDLRRTTASIAELGRERGVSDHEVRETVLLARAAFRRALMLAHFEDLRGVLSAWRYFHRWLAVLMVVLVVVHVVYALTYSELLDPGVAR